MAIYHLTANTRTRKNNDSAAASHDYITREGKFAEDRAEVRAVFSYNIPAFAAGEAGEFWRAVDQNERDNARLCKTLEASIPLELSVEQQDALVKEFVEKHILAGRVCAATCAIHRGHPDESNPDGQPHFHINWSERIDDGIERDSKQFFSRYNAKKPELGGSRKTDEFKPKEWLEGVRKAWATVANKHLEAAGLDARVDHRSLIDQGITDRLPEIHEGTGARAIVKKGGHSDRVLHNRNIKKLNVLNIEIKEAEDGIARKDSTPRPVGATGDQDRGAGTAANAGGGTGRPGRRADHARVAGVNTTNRDESRDARDATGWAVNADGRLDDATDRNAGAIGEVTSRENHQSRELSRGSDQGSPASHEANRATSSETVLEGSRVATPADMSSAGFNGIKRGQKMPIAQADKTKFTDEFQDELTDFEKSQEKIKKLYKHRLKFNEDDKKYYYFNPKTKKSSAQIELKIEGGREVLHALGKNMDMSAANMFSIAIEREWNAIEVFGEREFQDAAFKHAESLVRQGLKLDVSFADPELNEKWQKVLEKERAWNKTFGAQDGFKQSAEAAQLREQDAQRLQERIDAKAAADKAEQESAPAHTF